MADNEIQRLIARLKPDDWRAEVGFSRDLKDTLEITCDPDSNDEKVIAALAAWLGQSQPCLFGRSAAKKGLITFCLLRETDLTSDFTVRNKIRDARLRWQRAAFEGRSSGFIVAVLSHKIANATPDETVRELAKRVCSLYLRRTVEVDEILFDNIRLDQPSHSPKTWEWVTGVNYFSAQGDQRWWHDHRMPVGLAFSVNSVGHMVKSGKIATMMHKVDLAMGTDDDADFRSQNIDSLPVALEFAMRTINKSSETISGRATWLLPADASGAECPFALSPDLTGRNCREYRGQYHTDITLPSEYFQPDISRPENLPQHSLDFSYLFDSSLDNSDFEWMGEGVRIRSDSTSGQQLTAQHNKRARMLPRTVDRRNVPDVIPEEAAESDHNDTVEP